MADKPKPTEHPKPDRTPDRTHHEHTGPPKEQDLPKQPPVSPGPQPYPVGKPPVRED